MSVDLVVNISHQTYYDKCNPSKCEYTSTGKRSIIEIIAVLAGLVGGFKVAIDLFVNVCCMARSKAVDKLEQIEQKCNQ